MHQLVHSDPGDRIVYVRSLLNGDVGRDRARLTRVAHDGNGHSIMSGRMRIAMKNAVPFRSMGNFWCMRGCFLAVVIWLTLPTSVSSGTSPEATPQVQPVASGTSSSASQNPLLEVLKFELQRQNPRIHHVAVVELHPFPFPEPRKYLMIGWGIRQDRSFSGDFSDELFGFFVLDASLSRIIKVLKIVSTPRWLDYRFRFQEVTADTIIVSGKGSTYGDQPRRFQFSWNPDD